MGFINKLLGGVFAFIGGIFGTITKLLGLGQKSEYFLEADDEKGRTPATPEPQLQTTQKIEAPAPAAKETVELEVPATSASLNGKVEVSKEAFAAAPENPAPIPEEPAVKTFAPNFLVGTTPSRRRRPGPSLTPFLDMAKNMKPQG
jgi:hypothetical protein